MVENGPKTDVNVLRGLAFARDHTPPTQLELELDRKWLPNGGVKFIEFRVGGSSLGIFACKIENFDAPPTLELEFELGWWGWGGSSLPNSRLFEFELGLKWGVWSRANARPLTPWAGFPARISATACLCSIAVSR